MTKQMTDEEKKESADKFELEYGEELIKNSVPQTNSVISQLLTLNATLLCGSTIFFANDVNFLKTRSECKTVAVLAFYIALICTFQGIKPYNCNIDRFDANDIRTKRRDALKKNTSIIDIASKIDLFGFFVILVGLTIEWALKGCKW